MLLADMEMGKGQVWGVNYKFGFECVKFEMPIRHPNREASEEVFVRAWCSGERLGLEL